MNWIEQTKQVLKNSGIILYPTDTIWGIGCDATNKFAVDKIYKLKNRDFDKPLIILVESIQRLSSIVEIPDIALDLINNSPTPLTIIYTNPKNIAENLIYNNTIGIRLVKDDICTNIIRELNAPIVSTSANISGETAPINYSDISNFIKKNVDFIVPEKQSNHSVNKASRVIKLSNDGYTIIRK